MTKGDIIKDIIAKAAILILSICVIIIFVAIIYDLTDDIAEKNNTKYTVIVYNNDDTVKEEMHGIGDVTVNKNSVTIIDNGKEITYVNCKVKIYEEKN